MSAETDFQGAFWIGIKPGSKAEDAQKETGIRAAYFRHAFHLPEKCALKIFISASSRYRLWMNGRHIVSGPCKGDRWSHYYEELDLTEYLNVGEQENILAAKVVAYPPREAADPAERGPDWAVTNSAGPCMILKGECRNENSGILADVTTGRAEWVVLPDRATAWQMFALSQWMGAMEIVDGRKIPCGWKDSPAQSDEWMRAAPKWPVGRNDYGIVPVFPLKKRPIPLLLENRKTFVREMRIGPDDVPAFSFHVGLKDRDGAERCVACHIPPRSNRAVELDAGELTTGYFRISVEGGADSKIKIRYAESYSVKVNGAAVKRVRDDAEHGELLGHEDVYYPSGKAEIYEPFWWRAFRFVRIEVETGNTGITVFPPAYMENGYPLEVKSGIDSSVEWIEPLWDISLRTLRRCMHETYEDCPYYEQLQYAQDARLEMLFTYTVSGDTRMALRTIHDFHSSLLPEGILQSRSPCSEPQVIPAFSLYWIFMIEDYYWQTGDTEVVRRYRPTVDAVLDWFDRRIGPSGLFENTAYWGFADWVKEWERSAGTPPAALEGPSTIHNLFYACGLKAAATLMNATGREGVACEYEKRAAEIIAAAEKLCWSEKEGFYREGPGSDEYSQHAQVLAVLSGAAVGDRAKRIMKEALARENIAKCSFSYQFQLFRALEATGMYDYTVKLWGLWRSLLPLNLTTVPETPFMTARSDCHAWGALPLYEFPRSILGVRPLTPGWGEILVRPLCGLLPDAEGRVITPKGMVHVQWEKAEDKTKLVINAPGGVPVELLLPHDGRIRQLEPGVNIIEIASTGCADFQQPSSHDHSAPGGRPRDDTGKSPMEG